jgi:uncharacterized protein (TIGR00299 family) protein
MSLHLHLDPVGGVAGDMMLAALSDLLDADTLLQSVPARLHLTGVDVRVERTAKHQIGARRVQIKIEPSGSHRHLADILRLLEASDLPREVCDQAGKVFRRLAEAEAKIHNSEPEKVHFHEAGADDALVDIAGSCLLVHESGADSITTGPMPVSRGRVEAAHGVLPLPAPAVLELLSGWPLEWVEPQGETVTPTGAALVTVLSRYGRPPAGRLQATGYGAGGLDFADRPNLLRAILIETDGQADTVTSDQVVELVACIDDATGEQLAHAAEILLGAGALDVYHAPLVMKKGRPGWELTVLARPTDVDRLTELALRHSGSAGMRRRLVSRSVLPRKSVTVETEHGSVRIKEFDIPGDDDRAVPEYADCRVICLKTGLPLRQVEEMALRAYWRSRGGT